MTTEAAVTRSKKMELGIGNKRKRQSFVRLPSSSSSSSLSLSALQQTCSFSHRFLVIKFLANRLAGLLTLRRKISHLFDFQKEKEKAQTICGHACF